MTVLRIRRPQYKNVQQLIVLSSSRIHNVSIILQNNRLGTTKLFIPHTVKCFYLEIISIVDIVTTHQIYPTYKSNHLGRLLTHIHDIQ